MHSEIFDELAEYVIGKINERMKMKPNMSFDTAYQVIIAEFVLKCRIAENLFRRGFEVQAIADDTELPLNEVEIMKVQFEIGVRK